VVALLDLHPVAGGDLAGGEPTTFPSQRKSQEA
jgi:hypothetical protein